MPTLAMLIGCLSLGMEPALMRAIIEQESAGDPVALNVNRWEGEPFRPMSAGEAADAAHRFVDAGYSVDVGLAGINSANLERLGIGIETALDPCMNVALGETIFMENLERARAHGHAGDAALRTSLSLYNTGSMTRGFDNGYVDAVWSRYLASDAWLGRTRSSRVEWTPVRPTDGTGFDAIAREAEPDVLGTQAGPRSSRIAWVGRAAPDTDAADADEDVTADAGASVTNRNAPIDRDDQVSWAARMTARASTAPAGDIGVWRSAMSDGDDHR